MGRATRDDMDVAGADRGGDFAEGGGDGEEPLGPRQMINRTEYVRLLEQALQRLGYPELAAQLEAASGIEMQPRVASEFRAAVLEGRWDAALELLGALAGAPAGAGAGAGAGAPPGARRAAFLLARQKYAEAVAAGDTAAALACLRGELQPLGAPAGELQALAAALVRGAPAPRAPRAAEGRAALLAEVQALLPPSVLVPEARLEELLEQALLAQLARCPYHNAGCRRLSLLADYEAGPEQLPTECAAVLEGHGDEVWALAWAPDGRRLASAARDGGVAVWAVDAAAPAAARLERTLGGPGAPVNVVAFSPDGGLLLASGADGRVRLWEPGTGALAAAVAVGAPGEAASAAAWAPDGASFLVAAPGRSLAVYDVAAVAAHHRARGGAGAAGAAAAAEPAPAARRVKLPSHAYDAVLSRDGGTAVVVGQDRRLRFLRLADGREASVPEAGAVTCLAAAPDGRFLLACLASGAIHLWPLGDLRPPGGGGAGAGAAGAGAAAAPGGRPGGADPLDALPAAPLQEYRPGGGGPPPGGGGGDARPGRFVIRAALGGAGCAFVASGGEDAGVRVWHRESGRLLAAAAGHGGTVNAVAWHPRCQYVLASASDDRTVRLWVAPAWRDRGARGGGAQ